MIDFVPYEFRLSRPRLFAGQTGGLLPTSLDETDFKTGFGAHMWDEFEYRPAGRAFPSASLHHVHKMCAVCHAARFPVFQSGSHGPPGPAEQHYPLAEQTPAEVAAAAVKWKEEQPHWKVLRRLLGE